MIRLLALVIAISFISLDTASAKHRKHHRVHFKHYQVAKVPQFCFIICPVAQPSPVRRLASHRPAPHSKTRLSTVPATSGGGSIVETARGYIGSGAVFGRSNLWCARFMNYVLERTGHRSTGSDLAASFFRRPRVGMQIGAIAIMRGGHHVGIVSGIDGKGNPIIISGNAGGNRVREWAYSRSRINAFVAAL